jgi:tRNA nucleotidyltransferase (CCA-adding enzyme)
MSTVDTTRLARAVPVSARALCQRLAEAGHRAWLVGGAVRDELRATLHGAVVSGTRDDGDIARGTRDDGDIARGARDDWDIARGARDDWDIATDARPEQVVKLFRRVIPTGLQHGTVTVLLDGQSYEVTTLRGEGEYTDGRRPDAVWFVDDIAADLARRDFTVNALAYDALADRLIDPFDGLGDLRARLLRAVGEPSERFGEDGLRVLRAARFAATLEFELESRTAQAIRSSLDTYRKVSPERIRDEWLKAMKARRPSVAFELMREHGLLEISAPELMESVGCDQNRYHSFDVWGHALACLDACPPGAVLRLAGLLHDVGKPRSRAFSDKTQDYTFYDHERIGAEMVAPMLERLRFSNDERARITALVRHHLVCYDPAWTDAAVRRFVQRVTPELVEDLLLLNRADVLGKGREVTAELAINDELRERIRAVLTAGAALSTRDLAVDGKVLMQELGLAPGPVLGELLRALLEHVLDAPGDNQREPLLQAARAWLATHPPKS